MAREMGDIFFETSFTEVFLMSQWQIKSKEITIPTFERSNKPNTFSPVGLSKNIELRMFFAVTNSLALKKTQLILMQLKVKNARTIPFQLLIPNGRYFFCSRSKIR